MTRAWRLGDTDWNSWPDGLSDVETAAQAAGLGLAGLELGVYDAAVELAPARMAALAAAGVTVTGVLLSLPVERWPSGALSGELDRLLDQVRACADACRSLGIGVLGLWPGADPVGAPVVDGLRACVAAAGDVRIALEPKPGTAVQTAVEAFALCAAVPGLGVLVDTGHCYAVEEDPAEVVALLGDRLLHVHLGDASPGGGDDDLPCGRLHDLGPFVRALDASGFAGVASFDLYGAVSSGEVTAAEAVRESRDHVLSR